MKIRLLVSLVLFIGFIIPCQAQTSGNRIVSEVLNIYNDELRTDPNNYNVLFRRAHLFYGQNQYNQALNDITKAIELIPESDSDLRCQAYSLRANIYLMTDENELALADLERACALAPTSYELLYQKANTEYLLGQYSKAKEDYKRLERYNNRSLESLIGLARVAVKESNLGLANEYVDEAVALYPSNAEAYTRRSSVRRLLGNMTGAVDDLILALAIDKNNSYAISEIVKISHVDYNAVISALSSAISQAPEVGIYIYIRAQIQQAHYHYKPAVADYMTIIGKNLYNYHGINASLAECYYAMARFEDALREINYAIGATSDNASYYVTRSKIRLAMGDNVTAMESALMASEKNPNLNSALIQKGMCAIAGRDFESASNYIGEASVNSPDDARLFIIRGWILDKYLNQKSDASIFFKRGAEATEYPESINSLRGFALLADGSVDGAREWIDNAMASLTGDVDGRSHFLAAALYSQLGDIDKSLKMAEVALQLGYANLYDWKFDETANLNIAPLRSDKSFEALLNRFANLF